MIEHKHYDQPRVRDTINLMKNTYGTSSKQYTRKEINQTHKQKFYGSPAWRSLRLHKLQKNPVDQLQLLDNQVVAADQVHHIIKWDAQTSDELKWKLLLDEDNLLSLSEEMHLNLHYKPQVISEEINKFLQEKKAQLNEKYINLGYFLFIPPDSNLF